MSIFFSAFRITGGNFISRNDRHGGGMSSPSAKMPSRFLKLSLRSSDRFRRCCGGLQPVFNAFLYSIPLANSVAAINAVRLATFSNSFSSSISFRSVSVWRLAKRKKTF